MSVIVPAAQGLTADHVVALRRLCASAHVALAVIFGSRAHGEATATSDLDLLVLPTVAASFDILEFETSRHGRVMATQGAVAASFDILEFETEAQQIVGRPPVDLTLLHPVLSSALAWEALRDAVVLWEESPGTYNGQVAAWHTRLHEDAPRWREQALQLTRMFRCP